MLTPLVAHTVSMGLSAWDELDGDSAARWRVSPLG